MTLDELLDELDADDIEDGEVEVAIVEQPNYPLVAEISHVEIRDKRIFIHAAPAYEYYSSKEEEEDEEQGS